MLLENYREHVPEESRNTEDSEQNYTHLLKNYTRREVLTKRVYGMSGKRMARSLYKGKVAESSSNSNYSEHTSNISNSTQNTVFIAQRLKFEVSDALFLFPQYIAATELADKYLRLKT